jgi:hypothetical protein
MMVLCIKVFNENQLEEANDFLKAFEFGFS